MYVFLIIFISSLFLWNFEGTHAELNNWRRIWLEGLSERNESSHSLNNTINKGCWNLLWDDSQILEIEPGHRIMHCSFAFNGALGVYGGMRLSGSLLHDVWLFDPNSQIWKLIEVGNSGMSPLRAGHTCFTAKEVLYVFGGYLQTSLEDPPVASNAIWTLNLSNPVSWDEVTISESLKPFPRVFADGAFSLESQRFVIFGGASSNPNGDVVDMDDSWIYHLDKNCWEKIVPSSLDIPLGRYNHAAVLVTQFFRKDEIADREEGRHKEYLAVYGGHRFSPGYFWGKTLDDLWFLDIDKGIWFQHILPKGASSMRRSEHSMVEHKGRLWVFGGMAVEAAFSYVFDDVLVFDSSFGYWMKLDQRLSSKKGAGNTSISPSSSKPSGVCGGVGPKERFDHKAQIINNTMYIYGGRHFVRSLWNGDVWALALDDIEDLRLTVALPEFLDETSDLAMRSILSMLLVLLLSLGVAISCMLCRHHCQEGRDHVQL